MCTVIAKQKSTKLLGSRVMCDDDQLRQVHANIKLLHELT